MADTPNDGVAPSGETVVSEPLKNDATTATTPNSAEQKVAESESEKKLQDELNKARMEAARLSNQLKAKEEAEEKARAKKLADNEEYKTLSEQLQAKLDEANREREAEEQRKAVAETRQSILSDYSDDVKETAKDLGLDLSEVTDEAVAEFKGKLDKIQTRIGSQRVTPNNPGVPSNKTEYSREELSQILNDPQKRDAYFRSRNGLTAQMMKPQE